MNTPAQAIAWEIWRRFRWAFLCCAALIPLAAVAHLGLGRAFPELVGLFEGTAIILSASALIIIFCFCEVDEKRRTTGFPTRLFVLPIHTFKLVSLPVFYGVISLVCFYFAWAILLTHQWPDSISREQVVCYAAVLPAALASLQAIVWSLHRFNWLRALLLFGAAWTWLALTIGASGDQPRIRPATLTAICFLGFFACYAIALLAVLRERSGEWKGGLERFFQSILDALPWRRRAFASASNAQFWLEWRRRGWLLALFFALQMAGTLVLVPLPLALYLDSTTVLLGFSLLPLSMLWLASFVGMGVAKTDFWMPTLALPPIVAVRPISTGDMVFTKFKAAAAVILLGLILFLPLAFPAMQAVRLYHELNPAVFGFWKNFRIEHNVLAKWLINPFVLILIPGLAWNAVVAAMSPGLMGNNRRNGWRMAGSVAVFTILVGAASWFYRHPADLRAFLPFLPAISGGWLIWKWISAARAFLKVRGRGIFSMQQFAFMITLWAGLTAGIALAALRACEADQIPYSIIFFLAVWLLPGPEMPACGLNLALNRHR
jgi:hypothetical protein